VERLIAPALARGAVVVCDRFADSTRAYQGGAGGVSPDLVRAIEAAVIGDCRPDVTFILDLPIAAGLARAAGRGGAESRFEAKGLAFHEALRAAFLAIAAAEPGRCAVIDAALPPDEVAEAVWARLEARLAA
jgi:dTMP kinase